MSIESGTSAIVKIVRIGSSDIALMRALNAMFAEAFDDAESYAGQPPSDEYLASLLANDQVIALVAVQENVVTGGLVAYELDKFEKARREIYIYDLAVSEAHRRRGFASALISALRQIAKARAASVIFVQADYGDDPAIALYEKFGARQQVLHFDIPLVIME